ncbi:MAG: thiamine-phosphate kinase [Thermomicrobiales bacterium]
MNEGIDARTVAEIGEFALINALRDALPAAVRQSASVTDGIGDDAAIWTPQPGNVSVITTDTLVEGVHFRLDWTDWRSLGFKSLAVNLSDIAAMGATPRLATVSLGLRGDERVDDLRAMYAGMGELARAHAVVVAGGDIVRSPDRLMISVTAIGEAPATRVLRRSGAKPGDLVCVSGTLGASAAGLAILAEPERFAGLATTGLLTAAHLRPNPRITLGKVLADAGATAAMDLSDGLLGDLPKILHASGVGATIDARLLPVAPALRALFPDRWLQLALRGGEDYELLFTLSPQAMTQLDDQAKEISATVTAIGMITDRLDAGARIALVDLDGQARPVGPGAYDHFHVAGTR